MIFLQKKVVYKIVEREGNETQETRKAATGRFFCARRIFFDTILIKINTVGIISRKKLQNC